MSDLTSLIQQALDNGDTATARVLSRTLENQTRVHAPVHTQPYTQNYIQPADDYYYEQPVHYEEVREISIIQALFKALSSWQLAVVMVYIAIAEVSAPGHQGPLRAHEMHWFWGPRAIAGLVGTKLPEFSTGISEPQVGETEVKVAESTPLEVGKTEVKVVESTPLEVGPNSIIADRQLEVNCEGDIAKFNLDAFEFTLRNIRDCQGGKIKKDEAFANITDDTFGIVNDGSKLKNFTVEDLRAAGLMK